MNKITGYVSLTGGLGNQLFQLTRALSEEKFSRIEIVESLGKPRQDAEGNLEIKGFILPEKVHTGDKSLLRSNLISQKVAGYVLRMGVSPKGYEKSVFRKLVMSTAELVLQIQFRRRFSLEVGTGVGHYPDKLISRSTLFVGYFQSYVWAEKPRVLAVLRSLKPVNESKNYASLVLKANAEKPIIVHVRLGDYLNEKDFGVLSEEYYQSSIRDLWASGEYGAIWAFSDEPERAESFLPQELSSQIYWVPQEGLSSVQVLQLLRLGHAYVIGNSTFSWWGAFLSYRENPVVISPEPWFLNLPEPNNLIPPDWNRLKAR